MPKDKLDKPSLKYYIKAMTTYEQLRKRREARLRKFSREHVTGKNGGMELGYFMSLEGVLDNADSDIQVIKELQGRVTEFMRFCDAVPGQV